MSDNGPKETSTSASTESPSRWRSGLRLSRSSAGVMALLFGLVGLGIAATATSSNSSEYLNTARPDELVRVLQQLSDEQRALQAEKRKLEATLERLQSGSEAQAVAETQKRAYYLSILAGTVPVAGPGIVMTITDNQNSVSSSALLNAVQELRDAGAESISINGNRIVVNSWFGDDSDGSVLVSGTKVASPFVVTAIGDPSTLETAMKFPGGVVSEVTTNAGGTVDIERKDNLQIKETVPVERPPFVEPAK